MDQDQQLRDSKLASGDSSPHDKVESAPNTLPSTTPNSVGIELAELGKQNGLALNNLQQGIETKQPTAVNAITSPPNGGLWAWLQVGGSFFLFFGTWGIINAFGAYQTYYEVSVGLGTSSTISWIGTVQGFLLIVVGVITGPIFDLGFFRPLLFTGCFLVVFGLMMLSLATQYWQVFLAQGLCIGLGNGCLYVPSLALVATAFTTKRALAVGLATAGSSIGGIIYPIVFRQLQPSIGFAWATRVIGFITLFAFVLAIVLFHTRPVPSAPKKRRELVDRQAFKDIPFLAFTLASFLIFMGFWIPFFYQIVFAEIGLGTDASLAFDLLSVTNAASFFGRILPAFVAGRFGPIQILIFSSFAGAVLILCWIAIHNLPGFIVWCVLWGFFSGILASIPAAVVPSLSPSMDRVGTRIGMAWAGGAIGILIGNPIAGAITNPSQNDFRGAQAWSGSVMALGCMLLFLPWRHIRSKEKGQ